MAVATSFRGELEAAVLERHCANHPMTEKWARGELSRAAMMGWAVEHWHWISKMDIPVFYTCAKAPADVRQNELENFRDEFSEEKPHLPIVLRFARANGADIDEVIAGRGLPTTEAWANFYLIAEWSDKEAHRALRQEIVETIRPKFLELVEGAEFVPIYADVVA